MATASSKFVIYAAIGANLAIAIMKFVAAAGAIRSGGREFVD